MKEESYKEVEIDIVEITDENDMLFDDLMGRCPPLTDGTEGA